MFVYINNVITKYFQNKKNMKWFLIKGTDYKNKYKLYKVI